MKHTQISEKQGNERRETWCSG